MKNPLNLAFGLILKERRGHRPIDEIATKLGITPSFYRMMESGKSTLNSTRMLSLLRLESFDNVQFEQLSRLLTVISITDQCISLPNYLSSISQLKEYAGYTDIHDLFELFSRLEDEASISAEVLTEIGFVQKLNRFLTKLPKNKFTPKVEEKAIKLDKAPALYVEPLFDQIDSLGYLPQTISIKESRGWEDHNKDRFQRLIIVCSNIKRLLTPENFKEFSYNHIAEKHFKEIRILCLNLVDTGRSTKLESMFKELVLTNLGPDKKLSERIASAIDHKVTIKTMEAQSEPNVQELINLKGNDVGLLWIYELTNEHQVGFVQYSRIAEPFNGYTMSLGGTYKIYSQLEEIFDGIQ